MKNCPKMDLHQRWGSLPLLAAPWREHGSRMQSALHMPKPPCCNDMRIDAKTSGNNVTLQAGEKSDQRHKATVQALTKLAFKCSHVRSLAQVVKEEELAQRKARFTSRISAFSCCILGWAHTCSLSRNRLNQHTLSGMRLQMPRR